MRGATGEGFTIMSPFVRSLTVFWSWNPYVVGIKKTGHAKQLPYSKATDREVIKYAPRHALNSIATLRVKLNQAIMIALDIRWITIL